MATACYRMTAAWFLVIARQDKTSINAGMLYFLSPTPDRC
nr:hypothetical protein [uncultured bacterium]